MINTIFAVDDIPDTYAYVGCIYRDGKTHWIDEETFHVITKYNNCFQECPGLCLLEKSTSCQLQS